MKMLQEFKKFISRGNVLDMAVGVVVGSAFTAIVTSLVNDIIMPLVGAVTGGINFTEYCFTIGSATVNWGNFVQSVVNFLLVAFVIFLVVKAANKLKESLAKKEVAAPAKPSEEVLLLREIRDSLKK